MQSVGPSFTHHNSRKLLVLLSAVTGKNIVGDLVIQPYLDAANTFFEARQFEEAIRRCEIIFTVDNGHAAAQELKLKVEKFQREETERLRLEQERREREQQEQERKEAERQRLKEAAETKRKRIVFAVSTIAVVLLCISGIAGLRLYFKSLIEVAPSGRFILIQEGIIQDKVTGLQWMQSQGDEKRTWGGARSYTQQLRLGGYTNWRLPTKKELEGLIEYAKKSGAKKNFHEFYNKLGFNGFVASDYCSSTANVYGTIDEWDVNFDNGDIHEGYKTNYSYVRAVRNAQ